MKLLIVIFVLSSLLACDYRDLSLFKDVETTESKTLNSIYFDYTIDESMRCVAVLRDLNSDSREEPMRLGAGDQLLCNGHPMTENYSIVWGYSYSFKLPSAPADGRYDISFVKNGLNYKAEVESFDAAEILEPAPGTTISLERDLVVRWKHDPQISTYMWVEIRGIDSAGQATSPSGSTIPQWGDDYTQFNKEYLDFFPKTTQTIDLGLRLAHYGQFPENTRGNFMLIRKDYFRYEVAK